VDVDLRKNVHFRMSEMKADLVHGCRFLCRELFPEIRDDVLIPGGVFVWSHFIEGCEQYAPPLRCAPHPLPSRQIINTTPGWTSLIRTGPFVGGAALAGSWRLVSCTSVSYEAATICSCMTRRAR
jgi:hypothetical protein